MNTWNPMTSSYHLKIKSTQNKAVTFLFCLGHGLQCYFLMRTRNQKFFKAGEVSWNQGTSINILSKAHERKALLGKILEFLLQDAVKTTFRMKNLTQRRTQSGPFFQHQGTFFYFLKRTVGRGGWGGGIMCFSLSLAILCLQKHYCCFAFFY